MSIALMGWGDSFDIATMGFAVSGAPAPSAPKSSGGRGGYAAPTGIWYVPYELPRIEPPTEILDLTAVLTEEERLKAYERMPMFAVPDISLLMDLSNRIAYLEAEIARLRSQVESERFEQLSASKRVFELMSINAMLVERQRLAEQREAYERQVAASVEQSSLPTIISLLILAIASGWIVLIVAIIDKLLRSQQPLL